MRVRSRGKLMLIEDDEALRRALSSFLGAKGFQITEAADGEEAQRLLRDDPPPDAIVMDLNLPKVSGKELRRWQLADPFLRAVPVVLLTGQETDGLDSLFKGVPRVLKATGLEQLLAALKDIGG